METTRQAILYRESGINVERDEGVIIGSDEY
jgi:hypothetical protein